MSHGDATQGSRAQGPSLQFLSDAQPSLPRGLYTLTATTLAQGTGISQSPFSATRKFLVEGPQYALRTQDVVAVFPPDNSQSGDPCTLPHVVLSQSSRPWERAADAEGAPWLAVLLFTEAEAPLPKVIPIADLLDVLASDLDEGSRSPPVTPEHLAAAPPLVTVIDVSARLLANLLPTLEELPLLAHVRRVVDAEGVAGAPVAVVMGNRLPPSCARCVAHVVSLEGRYDRSGFLWKGAEGDDPVRLVTLKCWTFTSSGNAGFTDLLARVSPEVLKLPLPAGEDPAAMAYAGAGYVPLPHRLRDAESTVSFYRGPLIPAPGQASQALGSLPAEHADSLLRYDAQHGMLDVSYAAAWTLGRLLCFQDRQFSTRLYEYKHAFAHQLSVRQQVQSYRHLPLHGESKRAAQSATEAPELPPDIKAWLDDTGLLFGVPFRYLVPDERMLPCESLRFFTVDSLWVRCLLDGAFSVGRIGEEQPALPPYSHPLITGFLLRSEVVAEYPDLLAEVEGVAASGEPEVLVHRRLSDNVLLLLCAGQIASVTIRRQPAMLHCGIARRQEDGTVIRSLRSAEGSTTNASIPVPFRGSAEAGVIDIARLARAMNTSDAAAFALQMIDAAGGVQFSIAPDLVSAAGVLSR